jgi:hypothetical protein
VWVVGQSKGRGFSTALLDAGVADAGFMSLAVPFEHSSNCYGAHEFFLALRPDRGER